MRRSSSSTSLAVPSLSRLVVPFLLLFVLAAPANAMEKCDSPLKVLVTGSFLPAPIQNLGPHLDNPAGESRLDVKIRIAPAPPGTNAASTQPMPGSGKPYP